jgi:hypothetical protein
MADVGGEEELQQLRYERERLQRMYDELLEHHDSAFAANDEEQARITELNVSEAPVCLFVLFFFCFCFCFVLCFVLLFWCFGVCYGSIEESHF